MWEPTRIDGLTKTVCLIGTPVSHSLSPAIHNVSFAELGIDYVYVCHDVDESRLATAVVGMKALGFAGFNVTMPLKMAIIPLLDEIDPIASLIGAINVVVNEEGRLKGYNFDGAGFMRALREVGVDIHGRRMALIGTGGAGRAIYTQAAMDGMAAIDVFKHGRGDWEVVEDHLKRVRRETDCELSLHALDDLDDLRTCIDRADILVDASSVGMAPDLTGCNLMEDMLHEGLIVGEVVYNPVRTPLVAMAVSHGNLVIDGLAMLFWQAALSEQLWTGQEMPIEVIRDHFLGMDPASSDEGSRRRNE